MGRSPALPLHYKINRALRVSAINKQRYLASYWRAGCSSLDVRTIWETLRLALMGRPGSERPATV